MKFRKLLSALFTATCLAGSGVMLSTASAAEQGGTFNFVAPYDGSILSLDPHMTSKQQDLLVTSNIFRSLYEWNSEANRPVPELVEVVSVSEDGLTYTYRVKSGIMFHNGREMNADDVIWSWQRMLSMKPVSPNAGQIEIITGAKAFKAGEADAISGLNRISEQEFSVVLTERVNPAYYFYRPGTAIVPREAVEAAGDKFGLAPVGSGPFKFVEWVNGSHVTLEKFEGYYEENKPYLDGLTFRIMQEGATRDIAFRTGELDSTLIEAAQYPQYANDPVLGENLVEVAEMFTRLINLNPEFKPFSDKRVRMALSLAIDETVINSRFLRGKAYDPVGWLPPTSEGYDPTAKGIEFNVEKAKALMAEAGYADGFKFEVLGTGNESYGVGVAEVLGQFLSKINIEVTTQQLEGGILYDRLIAGDYQGLIWSFGSGPDPLKALTRWHSKTANTSGNYVHYNNADYDALLDEAAATNDQKARSVLLQKADRIFQDDAAVWIFNYNKAVLAVQPWVHGIQPVAIEIMYQDFADVWVDSTSPRAPK